MPAKTYQRIDLALEQLEAALMLFLEHRSFAAAITLAGAAEEVLGKELTRRGWQVALDRRLRRYPPMDRKEAIAEENRVRNALKHFDNNDRPQITSDLEEAARWMLERACENALKLELDVPRAEAFGEWYCKTLLERPAVPDEERPA